MLDETNPDLESGEEEVLTDVLDTSLPDEVDTESEPDEVEVDETEPEKDEGEEGREDEAQPDADDEDKPTKSKARREKQKAYIARLNEDLARAHEAKERISRAGESSTAPSEEDFPDPLDHAAALAVWKFNQSEKQNRKAEADEEIKGLEGRRETEVADYWRETVDDARSRFSDFDKVALNPGLAVSSAMRDVILSSDQGADVLYELGRNPNLASEIAKLSPVEAALRLGRIEGALSRPKPKIKSSAPAPIKPVQGRATPQRDPEKMSMSEYMKYRSS